MLLTAIAASPHAPADTLAALAARPSLPASLALALLANPAVPASAVTVPLMPSWQYHRALKTARPAARDRLLSQTELVWQSIAKYADLTADEIALTASRFDLTGERAIALAANTNTPHDLAVRAIDILCEDATYAGSNALIVVAAERGVRLAPERFRPESYDLYNRAMRSPRGDVNVEWISILAHGSSPAAAERALNSGAVKRWPGVALQLVGNMRYPEDVRTEALIHGDAPGPRRLALEGLSAASLERLLLSSPPDLDHVAQWALRAPALTAPTMELLARRAADLDRTGLLLMALHPQTTDRDLYIRLAHERTEPFTTPTFESLARVLGAMNETTILDAPVRALMFHSGTQTETPLVHHLTAALDSWAPAPDEALAVASLEKSFAGTVNELLAVARTITS